MWFKKNWRFTVEFTDCLPYFAMAMRVVSLSCSNTEIVCALACADLLVGVDNHSDYPAEVVARLPRVGPDLGIDIGAVAALQPDLVLASLTVPGHEDVVERLHQAGLNFIAPEPLCLDDVYDDIVTIADVLDVPARGNSLVTDMKRQIAACSAVVPPDHPSILVQWWPKPVIAPGRLSWVNDLLVAAGANNPLAHREVKSTPLEDSDVLAMDPDAMVISWCGVRADKYRPQVIYRNKTWAMARFVRNEQIHCIPEALLGRPSPRLVQGCRALRTIVGNLRR